MSGGEKLWTLTFSFDAWKPEFGSIRKGPLTVRRKVSDKELKKFQKLIDSESIVHIRARLAEENSFGSPQALLEKFVRVESGDSELNGYLAKLKKPVTFEAPGFGIFTLNRRVKWFAAKTRWCGRDIDLSLHASEMPEVKKALAVAKRLWKTANKWDARVKDYAVEQLLELKNDNWLDEDEHEVTPDEFKRRMTLEAITVDPDGSFDFWHNDGELFFGHSIQISGCIESGLEQADIPG